MRRQPADQVDRCVDTIWVALADRVREIVAIDRYRGVECAQVVGAVSGGCADDLQAGAGRESDDVAADGPERADDAVLACRVSGEAGDADQTADANGAQLTGLEVPSLGLCDRISV
ncbi:MAG: hypothetical protein M3Y09_10045 [Actinomycetota bacterium]|nr:hypothetical protein [Actinomycetota bacterium]MDQ2895969.1 hypothetical protein [Actinomycetota bacterium]